MKPSLQPQSLHLERFGAINLGCVGGSMLTDTQIAILCDIGQASSFDEEKKDAVLKLIVRGYVEKDGDLFKITPRGQKVLSDRGAGLNES
jgi:hypothetical protein